jgi:hypothetical protein
MLVKTKVLIPVTALLTALITVVPLPVSQNQANANATVKTKQSEKVAVTKAHTVAKIPYKYATPNYNKAYAKRTMKAKYGWGGKQYGCLVTLWNRESGWKVHAHNPSGAHGIPQALPGHKMSSAGPNWKSNPHTQIKWGLKYIKGRYGTPCSALGHSNRHNWY